MDMEDQDQNNRIAPVPARFQLIFSIGKEGNKKRGNGKGGISRAQLFLGIELIEFTTERRTFAKL